MRAVPACSGGRAAGVLVPAGALALLLGACAFTASPGTVGAPSPAPPAAVDAPAQAPLTTTSEARRAAVGEMRYRCSDGLDLRVSFRGDEARVAGLPFGPETLLRDAGGLTSTQTVYSSSRARAHFGLGPQASEVSLQILQPQPQSLACQRE